MSDPNGKVWLVTGANSGLGFAITLAALASGHRVIATARNTAKAASDHPEVEAKGGKWLELDVRDAKTKDIVAGSIEKEGGRIDCVVSNAGYTGMGAMEDCSDSEIEQMMDTNFYGCIRVLRGVLPTFRAQRSGTIINMGSILGFAAVPGATSYNCTKFALDGLTETLAADLAGSGIRVLLLMPGMFRTDILKKGKGPESGMSKDYTEGGMAQSLELARALVENEETMIPGDPAKLGKRVVEIVDRRGYGEGLDDVLRVPMGPDAIAMIQGKMKKLEGDFEKTLSLAGSTSFDGLQQAQGVSLP